MWCVCKYGERYNRLFDYFVHPDRISPAKNIMQRNSSSSSLIINHQLFIFFSLSTFSFNSNANIQMQEVNYSQIFSTTQFFFISYCCVYTHSIRLYTFNSKKVKGHYVCMLSKFIFDFFLFHSFLGHKDSMCVEYTYNVQIRIDEEQKKERVNSYQ